MKQQYHVRNWKEYNAGLVNRGSLSFWVSDEVLKEWLSSDWSGEPGSPVFYSDLAIETVVVLKRMFHLGGRQASGFVGSIFALMGVKLPVPDHTTVSRRMGKLNISLPLEEGTQARHVVVDSTGIKVYGEGEWKVRQHGISKRRTWRKLHVGVDERTGEIVAVVVSTNNVGDAEVLPDLLEQIDDDIEQVSADGAYDTQGSYRDITQRGAKPVIVPRKNAVIAQHGNCKAPPRPRDETIRSIRQHGRKNWKEHSGYHRRSIAETTMFRHKNAFGGKVRSRKFDNQATELICQCAILNRMIQLAKPVSEPVAA
jgi:IS5 family transposase